MSRFIAILAILATFCLTAHGLSPDDEVCQSIVQAASSSVDPVCQPLGDCTGISCQSSQPNMTVVVAVDKCTDPLQVNITVTDGQAVVVLESTVTSASDLQDNSYTIDTFARDDQTFTISMSYNGQSKVAIPTTKIPLNASDCTCAAIKHIEETFEAPPSSQTSCQTNAACTGLECTFNAFGQLLFIESDIVPCGTPPGFVFIVRDANQNVLSEFFFDKDQNETLLGLIPLQVTVLQGDYSITVSARLMYIQWYQIIPKTQIILDKSSCIDPNIVSTTMTVDATPSPSPMLAVSPETCQAIEDIRDTTNDGAFATCTVNNVCDTLTCVSLNEYTTSFQLLQCLRPPGIHFVMYDSNNKIYDDIIRNTTQIPIGSTSSTLILTLEHNEGSITVKVDIDLGFGPIPIIAEHDIPIDVSNCPGIVSTSTSSTTRSTTVTTTTMRFSSVAMSSTVIPVATNGGQSSRVVAVTVGVSLVMLVILVVGGILAVIAAVYFISKVRSNGHVMMKDDSISIKEIIYNEENEYELSDEKEFSPA